MTADSRRWNCALAGIAANAKVSAAYASLSFMVVSLRESIRGRKDFVLEHGRLHRALAGDCDIEAIQLRHEDRGLGPLVGGDLRNRLVLVGTLLPDHRDVVGGREVDAVVGTVNHSLCGSTRRSS